ncbi:MAG: class I SAM-dependent RNA methyltransferase [Lachnospiraceae bacterium]|nr:class I SAM-dependent RNA methyltransferase [Lachnospiraceae bacterium]
MEGCSVCDPCGGCVYQRIPYEEELALKDKMAREILTRALKQHGDRFSEAFGRPGEQGADILGGIYEGITGSPVTEGYRNKMEFSFGNAVKDGPITLGMHVPGHFMDVIDTPDCSIVDGDFRLVREYVLLFAKERELPFYHRYTNSGFLRNLLVRKGIKTGELLLDIVTTSDEELDVDAFVSGLLKLPLSGSLEGVLHTIHDGVADAVINEHTSVIYGRDHIFDEVLGLRFKISAFSFFQTNTLGAEVLYERVREYVRYAVGRGSDTHAGGEPCRGGGKAVRDQGFRKADDGYIASDIGGENGTSRNIEDGGIQGNGRSAGIVYDLYSGTGTIAQLMADTASFVYGVEIVPEAVEAARVNAEFNGIDNVSFLCGDVLKVLDEMTEKPDLIILDPPRDGVNPRALRKILDYGVDNIVYVSCKITSLARDLHMMLDAGYLPRRISVIDLFPRTGNFESIALLERVSNRKADAKVHIDVDLEDYYRIKDAQGKDGK